MLEYFTHGLLGQYFPPPPYVEELRQHKSIPSEERCHEILWSRVQQYMRYELVLPWWERMAASQLATEAMMTNSMCDGVYPGYTLQGMTVGEAMLGWRRGRARSSSTLGWFKNLRDTTATVSP
jgi:hypothetical protein